MLAPDTPRTSDASTGSDTAADDDRRTDRGRDRGMTFVETVMTVVLIGVVVVPVLAAVRSAIRVSAVTESAAEVETVLVNVADVIQRAAANECDLSAEAQGAAPEGWPAASVTVAHQYLDVQARQWVTASGNDPLCPSGYSATDLVKRITVTVTSPDGAVSRKIQVVKSNV